MERIFLLGRHEANKTRERFLPAVEMTPVIASTACEMKGYRPKSISDALEAQRIPRRLRSDDRDIVGEFYLAAEVLANHVVVTPAN